MEIMSVGYEIPGYSEGCVTINSRRAISDVDLVLISTKIDKNSYTRMTYSNGDESFDVNGSRQLNDDLNHWQKNIHDHVSKGYVVFVMLKSVQRLSLATGITSTKGKVTTHETKERQNNEVVPVNLKNISNLQGKNIILDDSTLRCFQFPETMSKYIRYEVSFEQSNNFHSAYWTKNKTNLLGGYKQIGKGYVVLLPAIVYDYEKFITTNKNGEDIWTKEAIKFGESLVGFLDNIKKNLLSRTDVTPPPGWSDDVKYKTKAELDAINKIKENNAKIEKLQLKNETLKNTIGEQEILRGLLYETGTALENSVIEGLKILGYSAENYNDGTLELDQVIISPEGARLIGECEGKDNKNINVTKFRQLNDSLAADFERDEVNEKAKGLLFGNPSRLSEPENRAGWFTEKAISGAKREGIGLIKTPNFYMIVKYIKDSGDKEFAKRCRDAINEQAGVVDFPDVAPSNPSRGKKETHR